MSARVTLSKTATNAPKSLRLAAKQVAKARTAPAAFRKLRRGSLHET